MDLATPLKRGLLLGVAINLLLVVLRGDTANPQPTEPLSVPPVPPAACARTASPEPSHGEFAVLCSPADPFPSVYATFWCGEDGIKASVVTRPALPARSAAEPQLVLESNTRGVLPLSFVVSPSDPQVMWLYGGPAETVLHSITLEPTTLHLTEVSAVFRVTPRDTRVLQEMACLQGGG